jgi:hypothetical protein
MPDRVRIPVDSDPKTSRRGGECPHQKLSPTKSHVEHDLRDCVGQEVNEPVRPTI